MVRLWGWVEAAAKKEKSTDGERKVQEGREGEEGAGGRKRKCRREGGNIILEAGAGSCSASLAVTVVKSLASLGLSFLICNLGPSSDPELLDLCEQLCGRCSNTASRNSHCCWYFMVVIPAILEGQEGRCGCRELEGWSKGAGWSVGPRQGGTVSSETRRRH